ncbi:MAG: glycosyltransferase family 2 protein, partial [Chloroflexi bacterium]|nr:glycosyltransferase family 2 protein [Chloroflexota bacterium]
MSMAVLIVSYQRPQLLQSCLHSLERQTRPPDEVIVVGVDGDEATAAVVQQFATICAFPCVWRSVPIPGVVQQTNLGLELCSSDIIAFTNDDAEPFVDWLQRMEAYYEDESVGGVGGRDFIHRDGHVLDGWPGRVGRITWFGRLHGNHHLSHARAVDVDVLKGVNVSVRRQLLKPLDLRMTQGGRWHWEIDMCFQVRRAQRRLVFDPQICVDHFEGPRLSTLHPSFVYAANHNLTLNLVEHFPLWRKIAFLVYTFLWGDYPEMGLAVFFRSYLEQLIRYRNWSFGKLLWYSLKGKWDAM